MKASFSKGGGRRSLSEDSTFCKANSKGNPQSASLTAPLEKEPECSWIPYLAAHLKGGE